MQLPADPGLDSLVWLAGARPAKAPPEGIGLLLRVVEILLLAAVDPTLLLEHVATGKRMRGMVALCEEGRLLL